LSQCEATRVDDEVIARMVISEYLRECGYRVIEAVSFEEASAVLQHAELRVDVVLCGMRPVDNEHSLDRRG
jgi:CheY-like chemotaxis protein